MAVTENTINSTGATTYNFTFEYLKTSDIKISVDGTDTAEFTMPTATSVKFNTGHVPASGKSIRVYRDTDVDNLSATFYAGSAIKSQDLNDNFNQNLYVTQEAKRDSSSAWQTGDETIKSTETWHTSDDTKVGTTKAIENRVTDKIKTALTTDVSGGDGVTIVDNSPASGQIRVDLDADIATLKDMQSGAATQLAALTSTELAILDGATVSTAELNLLDGVTSTTAELNILDGVTADKDEINLLDGVTSTTAELNILDGVTATKDELNILDGVTSTAAELNILDGVTATKDELNILDGVTSTAAELNILDGVTSTTAELNILDGVTATTAELNKTDGLTSSTAELNILDGVTATTAELNLLDGVTATTAELNKTDGLTSTPTELNILDGATTNTSEINKLDGVTASTAELNIVAGKSFKTSSGTLDTTSDTEIPSSKVIAAHVASSQTAIGGFVTIADEVSFPATSSMPANGVVVSINNAAGVVVNGSGVSTTGRTTDGTPATVTINNFPSSLNGETLAAGVGLIVTATSTANTYNYHKILAAETDVKQLSDDINDFNARYRVAGSAPGSNNDAGDMYFDTAANKMKVYNGTTNAWDDVASVGNFYINTISSSSGTGGGSATFNGSAYRFTLSNAPTMAQQLIVSVNGVIQKPNSGTSQPSEGFAISGNDIIFAAAPAAGSDYFIVTQGSSVSIGTPSDNTVTSAKIVDGSIVNGDISSSAAISEGKLDIHNAPATGKYLKYTSNGMEWSDGASEGTDVKSTGESGGTKFLREDGDGTSSWQSVPAGVGGANGADFNDDVKARFGTGNDLDIYHTGTGNHTWIKDDGTGDFTIRKNNATNLKLQGNAVYVQNGAGTATYFKGVNTGEVELFHNAAKKLETTSGGINVTGAITVNGAALETSPTLTGVADGALVANKPVVLTSAGKFKAISETMVIRSSPGTPSGGNYTELANETSRDIDCSFNPDANSQSGSVDSSNGLTLVCWRGNNSTIKATVTHSGQTNGYLATGLISAVTITTNAQTGNDQAASATVEYVGDNYWLVVWGRGNATEAQCRTVQWNGGGLNLGVVNNVSATGEGGSRFAVQRISNTRAAIFFRWEQGGNNSNIGRVFCRIVDFSGSGTSRTFSAGSDVKISTETQNVDSQIACAYDSTNNRLISGICAGSGQSVKVLAATVSGSSGSGTTTWGSEVQATSSGSCIGLAYDSVNNKLCVKWKTGDVDTDGFILAAVLTTSSSNNTISVGNQAQADHKQDPAGRKGQDLIVTEEGYFVCCYRHETQERQYVLGFTVSGTTVTWQSTQEQVHNSDMREPTMTYDSVKDQLVCICQRVATTDSVIGGRMNVHNTTTNNNQNLFMGFSKANYSDGDTATIKTFGNTATLSNLTPGSTYYNQGDGTIGGSAGTGTSKAGTALTATTLLIRESWVP